MWKHQTLYSTGKMREYSGSKWIFFTQSTITHTKCHEEEGRVSNVRTCLPSLVTGFEVRRKQPLLQLYLDNQWGGGHLEDLIDTTYACGCCCWMGGGSFMPGGEASPGPIGDGSGSNTKCFRTFFQ